MANNNNPTTTSIERIITEAEDLPSLPLITQKVLQLTFDPDVSIKKISRVISGDAALSLRFLKIVNSAYYGFTSDVKDIQQAVSILGVLAVRNVAITISLLDVFPIHQEHAYENLFKRSVTAAIAADFISQIEGTKAHPDVFLSGLLQNLGMFVLMRYLPEKYAGIIQTAQKFALDIVDVEEALLGTNHIKIGAFIAKRWELPVILRASVEYKNGVDGAMELAIPAEAKRLIKSVYLGGLAADIYWSWNKAQTIALFKKQLNALVECEQSTANDILSSLPHLVLDSGFVEAGKEADFASYGKMLEEAEEENLRSAFKKRNLYRMYFTAHSQNKKYKKEMERLKKELKRSNILVQKLALQIQK